MTIIAVPLAKLQVSPLNVRTNKEDAESTTALEASILAHGLLEPMIAHPLLDKPVGHYGIFAGGRRLRALKSLQKRGALPKDHQAEIVVRQLSDAEITEASTAENILRRDLRPYEVYAAYRNAVDRGVKPEDLAEHFGQRQIYVDQILRLGRLHPTIFAELEAGRLTDDQARAYAATEDQALQRAIFERLGQARGQNGPASIRAAMKVGDRDSARLLSFVGRAAYEAFGGRWERDLFEEADDRGRVIDEELLARLVEEKLAAIRLSTIEHANRDVTWSTKPPQTGGAYAYEDTSLRIEARKSPLSAEQKTLKEELDQKKLDIEDAARRIVFDENGNRRPGTEADEAAMDAEYQPVVAELAAIEASRRWILPKGGEILFTLGIDHAGEPDLKFWWASRKALRDVEKARAASAAKGKPEPVEDDGIAPAATIATPATAQHDLTATGVLVMKEIRRSLVRALLVEDAQRGGTVAQDYLVWSQLRGLVFDGNHWDRPETGVITLHAPYGAPDQIGISPEAMPHLRGAPSHEIWEHAIALLKEQSFVTAKNLGGAFLDFQAATPEIKGLAAAVVAGLSLKRSLNHKSMGIPVHDVVANATARSYAAALRRIWHPTPELLDLHPKAKRLSFVEKLVDAKSFASWAKKKGGEVTTLVVQALTGKSPALKSSAITEAKDWIHPLLAFERPDVFEPVEAAAAAPDDRAAA